MASRRKLQRGGLGGRTTHTHRHRHPHRGHTPTDIGTDTVCGPGGGNCGGYTCDDLADMYSGGNPIGVCAWLESNYGCDCSGCDCPNDGAGRGYNKGGKINSGRWQGRSQNNPKGKAKK